MINEIIKQIYKKRQKAHQMLLECDIALDKILKQYENKRMLSRRLFRCDENF